MAMPDAINLNATADRPGKLTEADLSRQIDSHFDGPQSARGVASQGAIATSRSVAMESALVDANSRRRAQPAATPRGYAACQADACDSGRAPCPTPDACRLAEQRPAPWHKTDLNAAIWCLLGFALIGLLAALFR